MNSKRFFYVMIGVTTFLGLSILGAVYLGSSMLTKQSSKLTNLKLDSSVTEKQQSLLGRAKEDIVEYSELKDAARQIVPQDKDQAQVVREITKIAKDNGVKLGSITFPSSNLGKKSTSSKTTDSDSASEKTTTKAPPLTQVESVPGIKGVFVMPITVQSDSSSKVTYASFIRFLQGLESNRRTAQVSSIVITPDKGSGALSFSLVLNSYIKP